MVKTYIRKPIKFSVMQYDGYNGRDIIEWSNGKIVELEVNAYTDDKFLRINTLEGCMEAHKGSYIVKGVEGEFWAVKQSIFEKTYFEATLEDGVMFND